MLGAIVIVGPKLLPNNRNGAPVITPDEPLCAPQTRNGIPFVCVEILGRSVLDRMAAEFHRAGFDAISIIGDNTSTGLNVGPEGGASDVPLSQTEDKWHCAAQTLKKYSERGIDATFIVWANVYVEFDLLDAVQFHLEQTQPITPFLAGDGPLDIWILNSRNGDQRDLQTMLHGAHSSPYVVRGYVNRLDYPCDLRRLTVDSLTSVCHLRPDGHEMRPGIWMNEGAKVHRGARIVAPAFIGRDSRIEDQCLITRSSNIESNCQVDYGTVVEDSTVVSNSYVGIGLDISHSIVNGNTLLNLERQVTLDITDPAVIRQNRVLPNEMAYAAVVRESGGFVPAAERDNR